MDNHPDHLASECSIPEHVWLASHVNGALRRYIDQHDWRCLESVSLATRMLVDLVMQDRVNELDVRRVLTYTGVDEGLSDIDNEEDSLGYFVSWLDTILILWNNRVSGREADRRSWSVTRQALARACVTYRCDGTSCASGECVRGLRAVGERFGIMVETREGSVPCISGFSCVDDEDDPDRRLPRHRDRDDVLWFLSTLISFDRFTRDDPLEGFLEVPRIIGLVLRDGDWEQHLRANARSARALEERDTLFEEFVRVLLERSFSDEYLEHLGIRFPMGF